MSQYIIIITQDDETFEFVCAAEDYTHALEQAQDAYHHADIVG